MTTLTTLKSLDFDHALAAVDEGAAFVDLRPTQSYLDVHVPGSLGLLYEFGPGMGQRARDCIPLEIPLVLLSDGHNDLPHAAASLRGKGFTVLGGVEDGINQWAARRGNPASTEIATGSARPDASVLDVGDPGAAPVEHDLHIPIELLWNRVDEVPKDGMVAVIAGYGVRASLAVGMLERAGRTEIVFWQTRS
jgi:rhodanese-related sulfurtransferase